MTPSAAEKGLVERMAILEAQVLEAQRMINELHSRDALKTQFLSNISHDLRTPLTAIITHAEILRDGMLGEVNERQQQSITGIITGGRQLLDMIGEILVYAKGAGGQLDLNATEFKIHEVVEHVLAVNEPLAAKKGLRVKVDVGEDLAPIVADRDKITHVFTNLVGNAIEFTEHGGVSVRALDQRIGGEPHLRVEVQDTGIGIRPEHHELIFQEFAQVDSTASRSHHGTGLGLAIARRLVELHDGRIWVESEPGIGSTFIFVIPRGNTQS
jgi:two-component system sensor histidine kinase BarA